MRFYRLSHPPYLTDQDYDDLNPIRPMRDVWLPGIICSVCGDTWADGRRLYIPVADPELRRQLRGMPIPEPRWLELAQAVRQETGVPADFQLEPGDVLGTPKAALLSTELPDFMHPFPGQLIVRAPVVGALDGAGITGFRPIRVQLWWDERVANPPAEFPALYELVVTGVAWRRGVTAEDIVVCRHCRRTIFASAGHMIVDEKRWDGSDFFHVDENLNIVLVTERVCELLAEHRFTNYECVPVG